MAKQKMTTDLEIARSVMSQIGSLSSPTDFYQKLDIKTNAGRLAVVYALANARLLDRKQLDYGPKNISAFGVFGVVVQMTDKFERLKNLFGKGRRRKAVNESIFDSFRDIHNYGTIAQMVDRGDWPTE